MPGLIKGFRRRRYTHIELTAEGELTGLSTVEQRIDDAVCLHLAPGNCLLRSFNSSGLGNKDIAPALALWAEASLPLLPEAYYSDHWAISLQLHGFVALPAEPLDRARKNLLALGARPGAVRIPELRSPANRRPTLVFWPNPSGLLACLWKDRVLYHWQSFPVQLASRSIVEQLNVASNPVPDAVYFTGEKSKYDALSVETSSAWPQARQIETGSWDLKHWEKNFGAGPQLDDYIFKEQRQRASTGDKFRLGLAMTGTVCAALFMFYTEVGYLERQAEQLRHQVSLLRIKAGRSEKVAVRSGQTLRQVRDLQSMTTGRNSILDVLKVLSDALPPRVRLDRINIERSGITALDGVAEAELDISNFLETLSQTPLVGKPRLTFTQKEEAKEGSSELIRFRMEARLTQVLLSLPQADPTDANTAVEDGAALVPNTPDSGTDSGA